jgi:hypothetical protein
MIELKAALRYRAAGRVARTRGSPAEAQCSQDNGESCERGIDPQLLVVDPLQERPRDRDRDGGGVSPRVGPIVDRPGQRNVYRQEVLSSLLGRHVPGL